jgi:hypothetical protein
VTTALSWVLWLSIPFFGWVVWISYQATQGRNLVSRDHDYFIRIRRNTLRQTPEQDLEDAEYFRTTLLNALKIPKDLVALKGPVDLVRDTPKPKPKHRAMDLEEL